MAVSANENRIKILATMDGLRLMRTYERHSFLAPRNASETMSKVSLSILVTALNRRTITSLLKLCARSNLPRIATAFKGSG